MRRSIIPLALLALAMAASAGAQLSPQNASWPNTAIGFLLTDEEKAEYSRLSSDAQAEAFMELFWARRDPNLKTVPNEFKLDFDQRVKAADDQFSWEKGSGEKVPGSLTDRGKVLALMALPLKAETVAPPAEDDRPESLQRGATQIWTYPKPGSKPGSQNKDDQIQFYFSETRTGSKDFALDRMERKNKVSRKVLDEQVRGHIVNPKINSLADVPRFGLIDGTLAATPAQLAVLDTEPKPWPAGAYAVTITGVQSDTLRPIWLHVQLPDAVTVADQGIGRVTRKSDGKVIGTFQSAVTAVSMTGSRAYEFSLPVDEGEYKVDIALLAGGSPLAVTSLDGSSDKTSDKGTYISPMIAGVGPKEETNFRLGDPFNVGGWRIIPRADGIYRPSEQLAYFAYVIKPGLSEQGQPKVAMGLKLTIDGKSGGERPPLSVQISKISETIYMFGQNLPLSAFAKPGEYLLEMTLKDQINDVTRTSVVKVKIVADETAPAAK